MDTTDRDIIARVLGGDRESFKDLVQRHAAPLWSTIRASLGNAEDAREVFQETWMRAFERLATLRDPERLRAWLVSIALNQVRQRQRRAAGLALAPLTVLAQEPSGGDRDLSVPLAEAELLERLRSLMRELPERQRQVMDLRVNHELSHARIAETLGIREDASRANYYQALRRLRTRLAEVESADERKEDYR